MLLATLKTFNYMIFSGLQVAQYIGQVLAILVEDLDDLQGLQGVTTETADGKRSKAGIYPLNGYLLLSFKREIFRFVWVEA